MSRAAQLSLAWMAACLVMSLAYAQEKFDLKQRFVDLHTAYLAADTARYTPLLRATLRHARRLQPEQCVIYQRQLIEIGTKLGYDGLEAIWLVYQDCAAAGTEESMGPQRRINAGLLHKSLWFRSKPLPQLPMRISHWNSALERGVRGDAVRELLRHWASYKPSQVQRWNFHRLLAERATQDALCALPTRFDQHERMALPELFRQAGCLTEVGFRPEDICNTLFPEESSDGGPSKNEAPLPGFSLDEWGRLRELCDGLTGAGSPGSAGMDDLDAYSSDKCASEDTTRLYDTQKITQLVMDCHFSGDSSNPLAIGGTSADIGRYLNQVLEYELDDSTYGAALMVGRSHDDPGRKFYGAYGATADEARKALQAQIQQDPPEEYTVTQNDDGSTTLEGKYETENPDGSTSQVKDTIGVDENGNVNRSTTTTNPDGSGRHEQSGSEANGSGTSTTLEWDANGNVTKKTETTTDDNGKTTTTTTEYEYNDDGAVTNTKTGTTTLPGEEGGFDPHNPACQELMALEVMPGGGRSAFWDDLMNRPYKQDPRTVYPTPDQDGDTWGQEPFCGPPGIGSNTSRAKCNVPVLCSPDTVLNDSCQCEQHVGGAIPLLGCISTTCPDGAFPVPIGPNACSCQTGDSQDPGLPPTPLPDAQIVNDAFTELIWNRSDGQIYITDEMVEGREQLPVPKP